MDSQDRCRPKTLEVPVDAEEFSPPSPDPLDSVLANMVEALENVRCVLADAVQNFPVLRETRRVETAVRDIEAHTARLQSQLGDRLK